MLTLNNSNIMSSATANQNGIDVLRKTSWSTLPYDNEPSTCTLLIKELLLNENKVKCW